jgi:predicted O-methyltransferase YrrM
MVAVVRAGAMDPALRAAALAATGFMPAVEGDALHAAALEAGAAVPGAPFLEVGSYCGRSTVWLGAAARQRSTVLFALDHHRGSEENQAGWEWHDPTLVDPASGLMDTLPVFRRTIADAGLEDVVVAVVGRSRTVARHWTTPLALVFIDGGHGVAPARADYAGWTPHVAPGGLLAIHDVFPDPADGGRPPYEEIYLPALASGGFEEISATGSLRVLRRLPPSRSPRGV